MNTISLLKKITFVLGISLFASCDSDFNELGADIIEGDISHNGIQRHEGSVIAFDKGTGIVQANNLPVNSLGIYNNPAFGKTIAHFVTQLELETFNPVFNNNALVDTVYLYVPYYSTYKSVDVSGTSTYRLDSIHGDASSKFRLSVYENKYFLRDYNGSGSAITGQKYYSDEKSLIENHMGFARLNNGPVSQNDEFSFSAAEVQRKVTINNQQIIKERFAPGIYMELDKEYFQAKIIGGSAGKLINNNIFKDYFRGLYFKVEQTGDNGALALTRFAEGKIVVIYSEDKTDINGNPILDDEGNQERVSKKLTLNLKGNTINFFENTYNDSFNSAVINTDTQIGDDRLYVKGGEGSVAYIDILNEDDLNILKPQTGEKVLINEANLTFYVDKAAMASAKEPLRLYLYDVRNKRPIVDYYMDGTSNTLNPAYNKMVHDGIIRIGEDRRGVSYKVRLTNHLNNVIHKDSANIRLAVSVTGNINLTSNVEPKNVTEDLKTVPASSVMDPLGTILYGTGVNVPEDKKLKFEIFYTKP